MLRRSLHTIVRGALMTGAVGILLAAALPLQLAAQDRMPMRIAVEGAFPPFNYLDANNKLQGFDIDIANALCEVGKFECQFIIEKWDDIIPDLVADKYDAIISYFCEGAGIALRLDDKERLTRLNEALKSIKADGTYDMINAKYFPFSIQ
ncbi:transporter substrate-binding domain-containing protein [Rhizobium ruizarguesonis]